MEFPVIRWETFLDALQHQQPGTIEVWLRRWWFTNKGVIMADLSSAPNAN